MLVDDHYEKKHRGSVNDEIILNLIIGHLANELFKPISVDEKGYEYFVTEPVFWNGKPYRLIWLLHPDANYVGVINWLRGKRYGKK